MIEVENCRGVRAAAKFFDFVSVVSRESAEETFIFADTQNEMSPGKVVWHISFEQFFQNKVTK